MKVRRLSDRASRKRPCRVGRSAGGRAGAVGSVPASRSPRPGRWQHSAVGRRRRSLRRLCLARRVRPAHRRLGGAWGRGTDGRRLSRPRSGAGTPCGLGSGGRPAAPPAWGLLGRAAQAAVGVATRPARRRVAAGSRGRRRRKPLLLLLGVGVVLVAAPLVVLILYCLARARRGSGSGSAVSFCVSCLVLRLRHCLVLVPESQPLAQRLGLAL
mmetsp:Transcript_9460/g.36942  ORF Transcript_9460/g.36942 Transcript_9460/m.36942 type:complete len:213 (-) Transcript_9460:1242-1880(-)